jgi:hypothetical protein
MASCGMTIEHLARIVEASEWFDWIQRKMSLGRIPPLTDEVAVLFAVNAIQYADLLEPDYGCLPKRIRERLIKSRIVDFCCHYFNQAV